ncbi:histidine phosphatase family protein [Aspergillus clavatus NRRL 1]|uniref:Phytase, putative n=1 Tax=Aspergillus clavatus (strain ATCC 1007 / CBS 513.65 / DSM 816 / NCTC 3887 / NRRL 1 / QM 1276 / 107) TaxID=344612 RepID=A1CGB6_ASPCL|nr:phytase, putative [Aspergillus clavatus NRRL 1]EAW10996.1 phytase, putative [Aspergillus clavatus NRRL 1]
MPPSVLSPATALAVLAAMGGVTAAPTKGGPPQGPAPTGTVYPSGFDMTTSWANLSPYKDAPGHGQSSGVPRGCELSQVHILHRHAQRFPVSSILDGGGMQNFEQKLRNYSAAHPDTTVARGPLSFLNEWESVLGRETLLVSGAATEATCGANTWSKYGRLLYRADPGVAVWDPSMNVYPNGTERPKPIFRTTSQERILESARWWLSGFFSNTGANSSSEQYELVQMPEGNGVNNSLASDHSCTNGKTEGTRSATEYIPRFTKDAVSRLAQFLPGDFNLTAFDVASMMLTCPYEFAALGSSDFCSLFTEQEWKDWQYNVDLQFYGNYGWGAPSGRAQGIGYILELAARLEGKLIETSDTSINATFDDHEATFPLHQPLFLDMSHDDVIVAALAALGMDYFNHGPKGLPADVPHAPERAFKLNQISPFGAHFVSEIWTCPARTDFHNLDATLYKNPDLSARRDTADYIRFVLNGASVPTMGMPGCRKAKNGFCPVSDFLASVPQLKEDAMYRYACFGEYPTGHQVGNGQPE